MKPPSPNLADVQRLLADPARLAMLAEIEPLMLPTLPELDRITQLAHRALKVPIAFCNFVGHDRSLLKSNYGLPSSFKREAPLSESFCQWVLVAETALTLTDLADSPFRDLESAVTLGIRGFLGLPLSVRGQRVGIFNLVDTHPRSWTPDDLHIAQELARAAETTIELRLALSEQTRSEQRFRALVESSSQVVFRVDPHGAILGATPFWPNADGNLVSTDLNLPQRPAEGSASLGLGWRYVLHPDDFERVDAAWHKAMTTHEPYFMECRVRGFRGDYRWSEVRAVPVFDDDGKVREWIGSGADVTDRRRAQEALQLLSTAGARLAESVDYAVTLQNIAEMTVGSFCDFCLVNLLNDQNQIEQVAVSATDPAILRLTQQRHGCISRDHPYHHVSRALATGEPQFIPDADDDWKQQVAGSEAHLEYMRALNFHSVLCAPIVGSDQPFGALVFARCGMEKFSEADVFLATDLGRRAGIAIAHARLFGSLERREREASELNRRKDEFLAMLAHEVRNPLAAISNAMQVLDQDDGESARRRFTQIARRQTAHLVRLIDDLLDSSRISQGKINLRREIVSLRDVLSDAIQSVQPALDQKQQRLALQFSDPAPWLNADRTRLVQAFSNLLGNASKFSDFDSTIEVQVKPEANRVRIVVRDHGIGIASVELKRIFEMFAQAEDEAARAGGGLGLGLAVARTLIRMHGGEIDAASGGIGRGSEFIVTLPTTRAPASTVLLNGAHPAEALATRRILIVDDNRDGADTLALILMRYGAITEVAYDGNSGLAKIESFRPDTVLLDIGLPDIDGYEVARRIHSNSNQAAPFLVAVTGYGDAEARERSHAAGIDVHLVKPLDVIKAVELIRAGSSAPKNGGFN